MHFLSCDGSHSHAVCPLFRKLGPKWKIKPLKNLQFLTPRLANFQKWQFCRHRLRIFSLTRFSTTSRLFFTSPKKWANGVRVRSTFTRCENSPPQKVIKNVEFLTLNIKIYMKCSKTLIFQWVFSISARNRDHEHHRYHHRYHHHRHHKRHHRRDQRHRQALVPEIRHLLMLIIAVLI